MATACWLTSMHLVSTFFRQIYIKKRRNSNFGVAARQQQQWFERGERAQLQPHAHVRALARGNGAQQSWSVDGGEARGGE